MLNVGQRTNLCSLDTKTDYPDTCEAMEFDIGTNSVYLLGNFVTEANSKSTTRREK